MAKPSHESFRLNLPFIPYRIGVALTVATTVAISPAVQAGEKTLTGPLTSVSVTNRTIQVGGLELEVSRRSTIHIDGQVATLSDLESGQAATVTYDDELAIVRTLSVGASQPALATPELIQLSELGAGRFPMTFWVSTDGLSIYWEGGEAVGTVFTASRDSLSSLFSDTKTVFKGRHPTLTGDGLEMILLGSRADGANDGSLHSAIREASDKQFTRPKEISELRTVPGSPKSPCLSSDGLTLTFVSSVGEGRNVVMIAQRDSRTEPWSKLEALPFVDKRSAANLTWVDLSEDRLTLIAAEEGPGTSKQKGNFVVWRRAAASEPFRDHEYVAVRGLPALAGRCPRYVEETKELYFSRNVDQKWPGIWVVRGLDLGKK